MNATLPLKRLFDWKVRGIRWIEIIGVILVGAMIFGVYLAKAGAAREGSRIADLERQIADNGQRVRLLRAEVARLEQPARLEALSRGAGLAPVDAKRQATEASLSTLVPIAEPAPAAPAPTVSAGPVPIDDDTDTTALPASQPEAAQ